MAIEKNTIIYIVIGIVVLAGVLVLAGSLSNSQYSVEVVMVPNGAGGAPVYNGLYPYNTTFFKILVNNTGTAEIKNLPIVVYLNGSIYQSYNVTVPKGEGASISMNYTYRDYGNFTFKAEADPAGLMNIKNRSGAASTVTIHINMPENASPYLTLPQYNTTDIQATVLQSQGLAVAYLFGRTYNSSIIMNMFGPKLSGILLNFIAPYTSKVYSAYAEYANGSTAYTAWLQGTISPYVVEGLIKSRNITMNDTYIGNTLVRHGSIDNNTTLCADGQEGWTKLTFYTGFENQTCAGFADNTDQTLSVIVANTLNNSNTILAYGNMFMYNGSAPLGSSVLVNGTNVSILNLFYNNYGWFGTIISKANQTGMNSSPVCYGILYNSTPNTSICSSSIIGVDNLTGKAVVNTTEILKDYRLSVYSLVNSSGIKDAVLSSTALINSLGINETPIYFTSFLKNTCSMQGKGLTCGLNSFNYTSDVADLRVTNAGNSSIELDSGICYFVFENGQDINATIGAHASTNVSLSCGSVGFGVFGVSTSYHLRFNYTQGGITNMVNGTLNVTSLIG